MNAPDQHGKYEAKHRQLVDWLHQNVDTIENDSNDTGHGIAGLFAEAHQVQDNEVACTHQNAKDRSCKDITTPSSREQEEADALLVVGCCMCACC